MTIARVGVAEASNKPKHTTAAQLFGIVLLIIFDEPFLE
jgi:hypothetical protein